MLLVISIVPPYSCPHVQQQVVEIAQFFLEITHTSDEGAVKTFIQCSKFAGRPRSARPLWRSSVIVYTPKAFIDSQTSWDFRRAYIGPPYPSSQLRDLQSFKYTLFPKWRPLDIQLTSNFQLADLQTFIESNADCDEGTLDFIELQVSGRPDLIDFQSRGDGG